MAPRAQPHCGCDFWFSRSPPSHQLASIDPQSIKSERRRRGRLTSPLPMGHGDGPRKGQSGKSTHVHGGKHVNRGGAFKAHRNVKRAVRDVDAENALRSRACAGVCRRCVQKVTASIASQPSPTSPPPVEKHLSPDPTLPRFNPPRRSSGGFSLASTRRGRPATRATAGSASSRRWRSRTGEFIFNICMGNLTDMVFY